MIDELKRLGLYDLWLSDPYWSERFMEIEEIMNKKGQKLMLEADKIYKKAVKQLILEMTEWLSREYRYQDLKKPLTTQEMKSFKLTLEDYLLVGGLSSAWIKSLEKYYKRERISRIEEITVKMQQAIETVSAYKANAVKDLIKDVYKDTYYRSVFELTKGIDIHFPTLTDKTLEEVTQIRWANDGQIFSERIWGSHRADLTQKLQRDLLNTVRNGKDPKILIKDIQNAFDVDENKAARLVYTEKAYFNSLATYDSFKKLGVKQYEIVATLDHRTTMICRMMDGKVFDLSDYQIGVNAPPFHVRCRTVISPYFEVNERVTRDKNGKSTYIPKMNYQEWYEKYVNVTGALDPYSKEADNHAEMYYESIRKMKNDTDKIAKNTGYKKEHIDKIKQYLFVDKHNLGYTELSRFAPDYFIAVSWQRLLTGKDIKDADLILLNHEMYELILVENGYSQHEAHRMASKLYDYDKSVKGGK